MNIILMGKPGCGKGTISKRLKEEFNYKLICAGDLLRAEKSTGSKLGNKIAEIIDGGNLVPDEMITELMFLELSKPKPLSHYFLIDGYPRTVKQAVTLDVMINCQLVLWINVSDDEVVRRNLERGKTSGRPDDSNEEVIRHRLENYSKITQPIKTHWCDRVVEIDGSGTPDEVYTRVTSLLFTTYKESKEIGEIL